MNAPSALEMKFGARSKQETVNQLSFRKFVEVIKAVSIGALSAKGQDGNRIMRKYLIGENVTHGQYGTGQVMAHLPDGRLQVRFEGAQKSRLIFPSYLV
jgi:hypothetical protein